MLEEIKLENFGPLTQVNWTGLGPINLVIGGNGTGKTFLLKALYSAMRTLEEYKRGDESVQPRRFLPISFTGRFKRKRLAIW